LAFTLNAILVTRKLGQTAVLASKITQYHYDLLPSKLVKRVACKRRSSVNSGAWLRRFDDVTGVEKSCIAKSKKGKKVKEKCCIIAT